MRIQEIDEGIRHRLKQLTEERSQSEIARKTGAQVAAVNRYVHGARIPGAFCASLVRGLGVNPSWLLTGEGSPYLSDVPEQTARLGGNLLELVEAMSAVSNMLLGELTGKDHLKVLRELNDALVRHENLRENLNNHTRPVFERLLKDLQKALDELDLNRANELRKAADQLTRLCDDEDLTREYLRLSAYHEFQRKRGEKFLDLQRRLFLRIITDGGHFDEDACNEGRRIVIALMQLNRIREALRVCRAVRALAGPRIRQWEVGARLQQTHGILLTETGRLRRGVEYIERALPRLGGMYHKVAEAALTRLLVWSGVLTLEDAMGIGERNDAKGQHWVQYANWTLDTKRMQLALDYATDKNLKTVWGESFEVKYGHYLVRQLRNPSKATAESFETELLPRAFDPSDTTGEFVHQVVRCQMRRLCDDRKSALGALREAEAEHAAMMPDTQPSQLELATHYRNALKLYPSPRGKEQQALINRARRFFQKRTRQGYRLFEGVV